LRHVLRRRGQVFEPVLGGLGVGDDGDGGVDVANAGLAFGQLAQRLRLADHDELEGLAIVAGGRAAAGVQDAPEVVVGDVHRF